MEEKIWFDTETVIAFSIHGIAVQGEEEMSGKATHNAIHRHWRGGERWMRTWGLEAREEGGRGKEGSAWGRGQEAERDSKNRKCRIESKNIVVLLATHNYSPLIISYNKHLLQKKKTKTGLTILTIMPTLTLKWDSKLKKNKAQNG